MLYPLSYGRTRKANASVYNGGQVVSACSALRRARTRRLAAGDQRGQEEGAGESALGPLVLEYGMHSFGFKPLPAVQGHELDEERERVQFPT